MFILFHFLCQIMCTIHATWHVILWKNMKIVMIGQKNTPSKSIRYFSVLTLTLLFLMKIRSYGVSFCAESESGIIFSIWGILTKICQLLPRKCQLFTNKENGTKRKKDALVVADHESDTSFSIWGIFTKLCQLLPRFEKSITFFTLFHSFLDYKWLLLPDEHPCLGKHMLYNTPAEVFAKQSLKRRDLVYRKIFLKWCRNVLDGLYCGQLWKSTGENCQQNVEFWH